jgi:hypothetical protein
MNQEQQSLITFEQKAGERARHRALIMRILMDHPAGLTTQQIVGLEQEYFGFTFLTDNRLRELRAKGWVESVGDKPQRWRRKGDAEK